MSRYTKLIILIALVGLSRSLVAQHVGEKLDIHRYLKIDQITNIQIYNANTGKKWLINKSSLEQVKSILAKSYVGRYVPLKPGHLSIKFYGKNDFRAFDTYMYSTTICFDPVLEVNGKPVDQKSGFSIILAHPINWEKLQ